jgi:mono/diheme cytochrome c family protein
MGAVIMSVVHSPRRRLLAAGVPVALVLLVTALPLPSRAGGFWKIFQHRPCGDGACAPDADYGDVGGAWYWLRSPEQERRVIMSHYNRYCVRCHGVDGRGVWDIPDVPDFTNARWQASRTDDQLVRATLEGRGAVMPPFRGTLTLEEAWGMARYLRTFIPGTEQPRPDKGPEDAPAKAPEKLPEPMDK